MKTINHILTDVRNTKYRLTAIILISGQSLLWHGCLEKSEPVFHGRLIIQLNNNIIEISKADSTHKLTYETIEDNSENWAILSPDDKYLLYVKAGSTLLMELNTRKVRVLFPHIIYDATWSPDGNTFSYNYQNSLYVYKLFSGSSKFIYQYKFAYYSSNPLAHGGDKVSERIEPVVWLSPDRLVIQRILGFPYQRKSGFPTIPSSTTTLATIGESIGLVDSQKRWWIRSRNTDGSMFLVSKARAAIESHVRYPGGDTLFVTPYFTDIYSISGRMIVNDQLSQYEDIGFIPGTSTLYFIKDGTNAKTIYFVDPQTLKKKNKIFLPFIGSFYDSEIKFIMDDNEKLLTYLNPHTYVKDGFGSYKKGYEIMIVDVNTRRILTITEALLIPKSGGPNPLRRIPDDEKPYMILLGWLE